jgi:hypothetical protein
MEKDYIVIQKAFIRDLIKEVNKKLKEGYVLQGGLVMDRGLSCQATVKKDS